MKPVGLSNIIVSEDNISYMFHGEPVVKSIVHGDKASMIHVIGHNDFYTLHDWTRAWKKTRIVCTDSTCKQAFHCAVTELLLPPGTIIYISDGIHDTKKRASRAYVVGNSFCDECTCTTNRDKARSDYYPVYFPYIKGEFVFPDKFSFDENQCASGIHFYYDRLSAVNYPAS